MHETRVQAMIREDPTCHRAAKPMHPNYWACALERRSPNHWAHVLQLRKPACPGACRTQQEKTQQLESRHCTLKLEKSLHNSEDPAQPKIHKIIKKRGEGGLAQGFKVLRGNLEISVIIW